MTSDGLIQEYKSKKILVMTKKTKVFLSLTLAGLIFYFLIAAAAAAESNFLNFRRTTMTAVLEEEPLKNVFEKVQKETGISFRVLESRLDVKVSAKFEDLSVQEGLKQILHTMNYSFLFDRDNNLIDCISRPRRERLGGSYCTDVCCDLGPA